MIFVWGLEPRTRVSHSQGRSGRGTGKGTWSTYPAGWVLAGKKSCGCLGWQVSTHYMQVCLGSRLKEGRPDGVWWLCLEGGAWLVGQVLHLLLFRLSSFVFFLRSTTEGHLLGKMWLFFTRCFPFQTTLIWNNWIKVKFMDKMHTHMNLRI